MRVGSLFTGIGGIDLGLERAGMTIAWQCEIDPYCRKVLAKHWPDVPCYEDVRSLPDDLEAVDLVCGGYPCQPFSLAGSRAGAADPRHLWPDFARVLGLLRPRFALLENVPGHLSLGFGTVLGDLAELGYDAEWACIPAAAVGAPHLRWRLFVLAHTGGGRFEEHPQLNGEALKGDERPCGRHARGCGDEVADANRPRRPHAQGRPAVTQCAGCRAPDSAGWWDVEPDVGRVADGVPARVDRLRALGNAVVPQVAELVGHLILEAAS
jgi:DNA (cytosine-5)-methyltransferase 1